MKQPELGRKICELRASKGLTQEELVDKCNVSVRTIQRIESGEVTPRSYTIKTIFAALDYDLSRVSASPAYTASGKVFRLLQAAWIAGIMYFLLGIIETTAEYYNYAGNTMIFKLPGYITIKMLVLLTFTVFQTGFYHIGVVYKDYLVKVTSAIMIGFMVVSIAHDIATAAFPALDHEWITITTIIMFGAVLILYGISVTRLKQHLGTLAAVTGILYALTGLCFISVLLILPGLGSMLAADLLGIVLVFKVRQTLKDPAESD